MSECHVKFQSPATKEIVNYLAIEYLKYILYYRGQFPLPLDQLKRTIQTPVLSNSTKIGDHMIYCDENSSENVFPKTRKLNDKTRKVFVDSIKKFDEFFNQLKVILQNEDVLEIVMNLGPNMMSPKELHRITLPKSSSSTTQCQDPSLQQRFRLEFFKTLMHSTVLQDINLDNLTPISVLLRLREGGSIKECMEQKRFYVPPQKCRQVLVRFDDSCYTGVLAELQSFQKMSLEENVESSQKSDLWVKLKSELKGFKNFNETQTSISSTDIF